MSTVVQGVMVRSFMPGMFADLTGPDATVTRSLENGVTTLTFSSDLDAATVQAIYDRMTSRDDADLTARANLRTLRDAAATGDIEAIRALVLAVADYTLGEAT